MAYKDLLTCKTVPKVWLFIFCQLCTLLHVLRMHF